MNQISYVKNALKTASEIPFRKLKPSVTQILFNQKQKKNAELPREKRIVEKLSKILFHDQNNDDKSNYNENNINKQ